MNTSESIAQERISSQRETLGVALPGSPSEALVNDPKLQGELLQAQIEVGEQLAFASPTSEFLPLSILRYQFECQGPWHDKKKGQFRRGL